MFLIEEECKNKNSKHCIGLKTKLADYELKLFDAHNYIQEDKSQPLKISMKDFIKK